MKKHSPLIGLIAISLQVITISNITAQNFRPQLAYSTSKEASVNTSNSFTNDLANSAEDVSKRTTFSSTWKTKDGKIIVRYSAVPINYRDAKGNMQPFDLNTMSSSLITGPTSTWAGGSTPSCIYPSFHTDSILVTVPAGINVTYFTIDYAYVSNTFGFGIPLNDGLFYLSTVCAKTDTIGCRPGDTAGICYLMPFQDFHNPFTTCLTSSCNTSSFWLSAHLSRYHGGVGCDTNLIWYSPYRYQGFQYQFSAYVEGTPIIQLSANASAPPGPCNGSVKVTASGGTAPYTYFWSPNNQTTDSIGNQCNGTYCCTVTDSKGCTDSICMLVSNASGINSISNSSSIKIYPNPTNGNYTISGLISGQYIEMYNYIGEKLNSAKTINSTMQFDITGNAEGVYLIRILNRDGSLAAQQKIVKE